MKALFIRCYGKLIPDMLVGGLIDMGVPPEYLKEKLKEAELPDSFIEKPIPNARVSAHYFHVPESKNKPLLLRQGDLYRQWREICTKAEPEWEVPGWKVFSSLAAGASDALDEIPANIINLRRCGVKEEHLISLYCFFAALDYLGAESLFVCPFSIISGKTEMGRTTEKIMIHAVSTTGETISAEEINPFAAAMIEGLSAGYIPMDGRFLVDKTAYGSASVENPTGESTVAEYLGYFTDREDSIFSRHLKVFGMDV